MKSKILTISVAAYNLGEMIRDNLEQIIKAKSIEDVEIIVTDDGSKDNTAEIVREYCKKYPDSIKLISQKNQGAGSTVNSGMKNATGKYFKMIDGDDWIKSDDLDLFIEKLKKTNADMVITNYEIYHDKKKKIISNEIIVDTEKSVEADFLNTLDFLNMYSVTYKTSILKENSIILDNGFYTDVEYLLYPIKYIKNIELMNINTYVYRVSRTGQSVSIPSMQKNIEQHDLVLSHLLDYYENDIKDMGCKGESYIKRRIAFVADTELGTILSLYKKTKSKQDIKEFIERIKTISINVYAIFSELKKARILIRSNYKLTAVLSKVYLIKNR